MTKRDDTANIYSNRERIRVLETEVSYIKREISEIKNNHLAHLQASINGLDSRLDNIESSFAKLGIKIGIITSGAAFVLQLILTIVANSL